MRGRGYNQFFRHENSLGCTAAGPSKWKVVGKAPFRCRPEHAGDNDIVAALRSKPEGLAETGPLYCSNLMLSRLGRCREAPGGTADDAFLTLEIPYCLRTRLTPRPPSCAAFLKFSLR